MIKFIWCNYNAISQKERARAILFEGASAEEFAPVFVWDGVQYFKKIK